MRGALADRGRRRFLKQFLREQVVEPVARAQDQVREDIRRQRDEAAYEAELRAFGPDVLADAAARSGITDENADYASVAKALAGRESGASDESP